MFLAARLKGKTGFYLMETAEVATPEATAEEFEF